MTVRRQRTTLAEQGSRCGPQSLHPFPQMAESEHIADSLATTRLLVSLRTPSLGVVRFPAVFQAKTGGRIMVARAQFRECGFAGQLSLRQLAAGVQEKAKEVRTFRTGVWSMMPCCLLWQPSRFVGAKRAAASLTTCATSQDPAVSRQMTEGELRWCKEHGALNSSATTVRRATSYACCYRLDRLA